MSDNILTNAEEEMEITTAKNILSVGKRSIKKRVSPQEVNSQKNCERKHSFTFANAVKYPPITADTPTHKRAGDKIRMPGAQFLLPIRAADMKSDDINKTAEETAEVVRHIKTHFLIICNPSAYP